MGRSERCEEHSEMSAPCCAHTLAGTSMHSAHKRSNTTQNTAHSTQQPTHNTLPLLQAPPECRVHMHTQQHNISAPTRAQFCFIHKHTTIIQRCKLQLWLLLLWFHIVDQQTANSEKKLVLFTICSSAFPLCWSEPVYACIDSLHHSKP